MLSKLARLPSITRAISSNKIKFSTTAYLKKEVLPFSFIVRNAKEVNRVEEPTTLSKELSIPDLIRYAQNPVLWFKHPHTRNDVYLSSKYSELTSYLNTNLKDLISNNKSVKAIKLEELNSLLKIISELNYKVKGSELRGIGTELYELIFNNEIYTGGYDQLTISCILDLFKNSNYTANSPKLITSLTNSLIKDNYKLDKLNLSLLINNLFNYKQLDTLKDLYTYLEVKHQDLLTQQVYHSFIKNYAINKDLESCESLISKMKSSNLELSHASINSLIHGYGSIGNYPKLIEYMNESFASSYKTDRPLALAQAALSYLVRSADNGAEIEKLVEKAQTFSHDLDYYNIIIQYNVFKGEIDTAKELLNTMGTEGILPNTSTYYPLFSYYASVKDLEQATKLFTSFKESIKNSPVKGIDGKPRKIGKIVYNTLIKLATELEDPSFAEKLLTSAKSEKIILTPHTFSPLLNCYFNLNDQAKAIELYNQIKKQYNFSFNLILFDIYLKSIYSLGDLNLGKSEFFKAFNQHKLDEQIVKTNAFGIGQAGGSVEEILEFLNNPRLKGLVNESSFEAAYNGLMKNPSNLDAKRSELVEKFKVEYCAKN
jgi:hypothetical protein